MKLAAFLLVASIAAAPLSAQLVDGEGDPYPVVRQLDLLRLGSAAWDAQQEAYVVRLPDGRRAQYEPLWHFFERRWADKINAATPGGFLLLRGVEPRTVTVPEIRYETQYVDRVVEKPIDVPVEVPVDRPVYVDRAVYVDKPVLQTIEKPVYVDRPLLPTRQAVGVAVCLAILTGLAGYAIGAHGERQRVQRLRVTLPELDALTGEARRVAEEHLRTIDDLLRATAAAEET